MYWYEKLHICYKCLSHVHYNGWKSAQFRDISTRNLNERPWKYRTTVPISQPLWNDHGLSMSKLIAISSCSYQSDWNWRNESIWRSEEPALCPCLVFAWQLMTCGTRSPSPPNQAQTDLYLEDLGISWTILDGCVTLLHAFVNLLWIFCESYGRVSSVA